jgi:hypothetical protein
MALVNMNSVHFSADEKTAIATALATLETALAKGLINLSAVERQQFGSVNEQNKLIINKVKEYNENQPALSSPDIDWTEFDKDYQSRQFIQDILQRLDALSQGLQSAKILHDWDNYQASLTDYGYAQYKKGSGAVGYDTKLNEIKQFFTRSSAPQSANKSANTTEDGASI